MKQSTNTLHIIFTVVGWGLLCISLLCFLFTWNSLPQKIGVHFDEKGNFDVISDKENVFHAFYPYIISLITLVFCEVFAFLSKRVKTGLKINETGERKLRWVSMIFSDIIKVDVTIFFSGNWGYSLIRQQPLNIGITFCVFHVLLVSLLFMVVSIIFISVKYKTGRKPGEEVL